MKWSRLHQDPFVYFNDWMPLSFFARDSNARLLPSSVSNTVEQPTPASIVPQVVREIISEPWGSALPTYPK